MSTLTVHRATPGLLTVFLLCFVLFPLLHTPCVSQDGAKDQKQQKKKEKQNETDPEENGERQRSPETVRTLTGLTDTEAESIYHSLLQHAYFSLDYRDVSEAPSGKFKKLTMFKRLEKETSGSENRVLRIGLKHYPAKDSSLIVDGHRTVMDETEPENPDLSSLLAYLEDEQKQVKEDDKEYEIHELQIKFHQLSSILPSQCLEILDSLGYNTSKPAEGERIPYSKLPVVYRTPENKQPIVISENTNLEMNTSTQSAPQNRLVILYHPSQRDQLVKLRNLLENRIDVMSRQVLIESLVVELTEEGRRELGVEWRGRNDRNSVSGSFETDVSGDTPLELTTRFFTFEHGMDELQARLRALTTTNEAEVLSSPSVLTLNNTQARIEVIQEVPIIKTIVTEVQDLAKVDVDFKDVGITLNIKPRITSNGEKVTMQIQGEVSEAPLSDFVEVNGEKVAPLINRRRVQSIAQVNNNTPFIIGGLIREKESSRVDRIPLISRLPVLGYLFQVRENVTERLEDIIVLNPRVIAPEGSKRPIKPKDSERFDFLDNQLFRNSYRLKSNDVFDLSFIEGNERIQEWLRRAREFVTRNPEFKDRSPFKRIQNGTIPGEKAMVVRMIYEITKKLNLPDRIDPGNLIYFQEDSDNPAGFEVQFLQGKLREAGLMNEKGEFVEQPYPRNALLLRYDLHPGEIEKITKTPAAEVEIREVKSPEEAEQLWQKENRMKGYRRPRTTLVIDDRDDLVRLKTAIIIREIISVNDALLQLDQFRVGRKIVIPQLEEDSDRIFLIDQNVSEYSYQSEFYYAVLKNMLRRYHEGIQEILEQHGK